MACRRNTHSIPARNGRNSSPTRSVAGRSSDGIEFHDETDEPDVWLEASALANTIEDDELTDPNLAPEQLLYRLFHEKGVRVFDGQPLRDVCRCSEERVRNMLQQFSVEERNDMIADGEIYVICEFCSTRYDFDLKEFE